MPTRRSAEKQTLPDPRDVLPRLLGKLAVKKQAVGRAVHEERMAAFEVRSALGTLKGQVLPVSGEALAVLWAGNPEPMYYGDRTEPVKIPLENYVVGEIDKTAPRPSQPGIHYVWLVPQEVENVKAYGAIIDKLHIATPEEIASLGRT